MSLGVVYPSGESRWSSTNTITVTFKPTLSQRVFGVAEDGRLSPFGSIRLVPNKRPPVNPWRHAYVRAKHFRTAARMMRRELATLPHAGRFEVAAENAAWGCR